MDLLDQLQTRLLCADGAMGTLLLAGNVPPDACLEELCVSDPHRVRMIHEQYVGAGAQLIATNTFGANAVRLQRFGFEARVGEINRAAAAIARRAANGKDVLVAGSVGPLGINTDEATARGIDRAACFREQITALLDGGAQLLCFETFTYLDELLLALRAKDEVSTTLAICSVACDAKGQLACKTHVVDAVARLRATGAAVAGVNCVSFADTLRILESAPNHGVLAASPSAGWPRRDGDRLVYAGTHDDFAVMTRRVVRAGVRLVGGCCGTTPKHVSAIATTLAQLGVSAEA